MVDLEESGFCGYSYAVKDGLPDVFASVSSRSLENPP